MLTGWPAPAYDEPMPILRAARLVLCVLTVFAALVGAVPVSVKACGCPVPTQTLTPLAAKSCCGTSAKSSCCSAAKKVTPGRCCGDGATPATPRTALATCGSPQCNCDRPSLPPSEPATPPSTGDSTEIALVADFSITPTYLPLPAADRALFSEPRSPHLPTNLVIALSRLTC